MKRFLYLVLLFSISCPAKTISPEHYGAWGDSSHDDTGALNKCIQSGKAIKLKKGKTYRIKSRLDAISNETFMIDGRGATIVIDKCYPLSDSFDHLFRFDNSIDSPSLFSLSNLNIECELGQKFLDTTKRGDTYFIDINKCESVELKKVSFTANGRNSNLTFLTSLGSNVMMRDCDIRVNTLSIMGGIFWLMNINKQTCNIDLQNCFFEHDAADEAICFSNAGTYVIPEVKINVLMKNCTLSSKAEHPSAGFMASYNMSCRSHMYLNAKFENILFQSDGRYYKNILRYDCGKEVSFNYGKFEAIYNNCTFNLHAIEETEKGLLGLIAKNTNSVQKEDVSHTFINCTFDVVNIWPIIGDKDGNHKGYYKFYNCNIISNGRAFQKIYNQTSSDITLEVKGCNVKCKDTKIVITDYIEENNVFVKE